MAWWDSVGGAEAAYLALKPACGLTMYGLKRGRPRHESAVSSWGAWRLIKIRNPTVGLMRDCSALYEARAR
jgi:hypothetical protein